MFTAAEWSFAALRQTWSGVRTGTDRLSHAETKSSANRHSNTPRRQHLALSHRPTHDARAGHGKQPRKRYWRCISTSDSITERYLDSKPLLSASTPDASRGHELDAASGVPCIVYRVRRVHQITRVKMRVRASEGHSVVACGHRHAGGSKYQTKARAPRYLHVVHARKYHWRVHRSAELTPQRTHRKRVGVGGYSGCRDGLEKGSAPRAAVRGRTVWVWSARAWPRSDFER